jgi:UDP-glucose 4-epimerase
VAGHDVVGVDNLSTGRSEFLADAASSDAFAFHRLDLIDDADTLHRFFDGVEVVVHLAAHADVRFGWESPRRDLQQNIVATLNVLDAMRAAGTRRILFASTGSVYGESACIPTPEDAPFPVQTSLYGASKLAAEGYLAAYAEAGHVSATVFRFVSILGPRYTHGHVIDFVARLRRNPDTLRVLGDGTQRKSYLEVGDCVAAMVSRLGKEPGYEVFNLGVDDYCSVADSIGWITARMGVAPALTFSGGDRGWVGDNPFIYLDASRMRAEGWEPMFTIREAVDRTVDFLLDTEWLLDSHDADHDR